MQKELTYIFSVSEITKNIKVILENNFSSIWVEGEISGYKVSSAGHAYFSLKDKNAVLPVSLFLSARRCLKFEPQDGLKVIAFGRISLYEPKGAYSLYAERIEPKGLGALNLAFEQLKKRLEQEGLFAPEKKKKIPLFPRTIGIVTSKTGAAIKDILNVLSRRFANLNIIIKSVRVQGQGAAEEIAEAIKELNQFNEELTVGSRGLEDNKIDVLIVGRGGGSLEDLWAFNEEVVARAIYNSEIPVISAVGHQVDFTIADFVSDLRAETPSAAAELVIANKESILRNLAHLKFRLKTAVENSLENKIRYFNNLRKDCIYRKPENRVLFHIETLGKLNEKLKKEIKHFIQFQGHKLAAVSSRLEALSPLSVLSRGYSISFLLPAKKIIVDTKQLKAGDEVETKLKKGFFISRVEKVYEQTQ